MLTKQFILAGDATFTIECPPEVAANHRPHYTYRVQKVEANDRWPEAWFVKTLTGPDNESSYTYLGKLDPFTSEVKLTAKSCDGPDAFRYRILNRVLARVWCDDHAAYEEAGYKLHHEGRCGRCGRKLTVPESVESGIGPECAKKL